MAKARFEILPILWKFARKLGLTSDDNPRDVPVGGLYVTDAETGALNIRSVGKDQGVWDGIEPIYGNTFSYALDAPIEQNKIFRLMVDISAVTSGTDSTFRLTLSSPTGTVFLSANTTLTAITSIATVLTSVEGVVTGVFASFSPTTSVTQTGTSAGYVEIEFTSVLGYNWDLSVEVTTNAMEMIVTTIQESVDISMLGEWNLIGSNDRIGDSFQFWTTRRGLPVEMQIINVFNPASTTIRIETVSDHDLVNGQSVLISGVEGVPESNGEWIIANVTATTFDLLLAVWLGGTGYQSGGVVASAIYGLGEIGVATEDNNAVISYTRLIRSNEFNFSTLKQIDSRTKRKQDAKVATYFVDNLNQYRVFYYKGAYITDGAVTGTNAQYAYGSISLDMQLFISNEGFGVQWVSQGQTGGSLKSGNWRYAVRFLTRELAPSEWSQITDGVPVFTANTSGNPTLLLGDEEFITTPKTNTLEVTNGVPGIYEFCEIAAVNYINGGSFVGYIIGRYVLDGNATQSITHTGNENNLVDLDIGTLGALIPAIQTGRNVELLDNRLVISNLTPSQTRDFTEWVESFMYSIERDTITNIGVYTEAQDELVVGEYQLPENVYSKKSHMIYETYRYGFRFRLKNGQITQVFYFGEDIKIDLPLVPSSRRIPGSFTTFDLTDNNGPPTYDVYSIYIKWLNINLSFPIDGIPVHDLISEIIPCRADVVPTVLAMGLSILGVSGVLTEGAFRSFDWGLIANPSSDDIGPFLFASGSANTFPIFSPNPDPTYDEQTVGAPYNDPHRDSVFFYSPEISFGLINIVFRQGDQLINFGNAGRHDVQYIAPGAPTWEGAYSEYNGYTNIAANPIPYAINESLMTTIEGSGLPIVVDGKTHSTYGVTGAPAFITHVPSKADNCLVIGSATNVIDDSGASIDYGCYQSLYYRPLVNQYGDSRTTIYTEYGTPYQTGNLTGIITSGDILSYGDCFTQKTYIKQRLPGETASVTPYGFGCGIGYYAQNRANIQLRRKPTPTTPASEVITSMSLEVWLSSGVGNTTNPNIYILGRDTQFFYNTGYTPRNGITSARGFDSTADYQLDWGNAIMWSNSEVDGSNTDFLRIFSPLDIKFEDYTYGAIIDARAINGELITVQESQVLRQYFNTTELTTTEIGSEVILGDGGVMRRKPQTLTKFGSQHKWSVLVWKSDKGHDVLGFIDLINKTACRYGYNGNDAIDEINMMKSFFANNLQWVSGKDTPAHDEGIHGVSNQRYREVIWTFRGRKEVSEWIRNDVSDNLIEWGETTYGDELVINGAFAGPSDIIPIELDGNVPGWEQFGANPPITWFWSPPNPSAGITTTNAYKDPSTGTGDYLQQITPLNYTVGDVYSVAILVHVTDAPLQVRFQIGVLTYTITTPGQYYFTYTAQPGDDNIIIYGPGLAEQIFTNISVRQIISSGNWFGGTSWIVDAGGATATGIGTTALAQLVPVVVIPQNYILTYNVVYGTIGAVTAMIGDQADTPVTASGQYIFSATPTVNGEVTFVPSGGFDGRVTRSMTLVSDNAHNYFVNDVVQVPGVATFSQTPDIFIAVADNSNSYPSVGNPEWALVPHTDGNFYSEFSIIFAELKDAFSSFFSIKPKIFAEFRNRYLVPRPISDTGRIYESDSGIPTAWFASDDGSQSSEAYFDAVINQPMGRKHFLNVRVEADIAPVRMEVTTPTQISDTPNSSFLERPTGEFDAPVRNDKTVTNASDGDTSQLFGDYAIFRFVIPATEYNKINNFVAKVRVLARKYFK